jgi:hypothetical protein
MATIKGKWQFTNDSRRMKDHPVHYCEQLVNFISTGYYDGTKMFTKLIFEYDAYDMPYIKFYCGEMSEYKFLTRSDTGAINLSVISLVDFGDTPQNVSDDFLDLMNLVAVPTNDDGTVTLNGKYVVSPAGIGNIWAYGDLNASYYGPPKLYYINYTTIEGRPYDALSFYHSSSSYDGSLYFGSSYGPNVSTNGFVAGAGLNIIDFGQQNQTIDAIFYGEVLRYALIPYEQGFVDVTGLATMVAKLKTKTTNQITTAAKNAKAGITTLMAFNSSSTKTSYSNSSLVNYDMLFLIATPSTSATQIFLTIPMQSISSGAITEFYVAAHDNTNTTHFKVTASKITASEGFNQNYASATAGYIKGVYGLKIGG